MSRLLRLFPIALTSLALLTSCMGKYAGNSIGNASLIPRVGDATNRQVFHFIGGSQIFQVPSDVDKLTITVKGAGTPSARGGLVKAIVTVHPGDVVTIIVGGAPRGVSGGYNGGASGGLCPFYGPCQMTANGGAGASDVRIGGDDLQDRIVVAGGAGGRGGRGQFHGAPGGEGGGVSGAIGDDGIGARSPFGLGKAGGGGGGGGGTQLHGGRQGAAGKAPSQFMVPGIAGKRGSLASGGPGAYAGSSAGVAGGAGGGGGGGYYGGGGGGSGADGGYYEGGGGNLAGVGSGGGGGGGSSFAEPGAQNVRIESGKGNSGDGLIIISW